MLLSAPCQEEGTSAPTSEMHPPKSENHLSVLMYPPPDKEQRGAYDKRSGCNPLSMEHDVGPSGQTPPTPPKVETKTKKPIKKIPQIIRIHGHCQEVIQEFRLVINSWDDPI